MKIFLKKPLLQGQFLLMCRDLLLSQHLHKKHENYHDLRLLYPPEWHKPDIAQLRERLSGLNLKVTNLNSFTLYAVGDVILPSWIDADRNQRSIRIEHTRSCLKLKRLGFVC